MVNKFFLAAAAAAAVDQLSKWLVLAYLKHPLYLLPFLDLRYSTNTGIAFGLLKEFSFIPLLVSIGVIGAIIYYYDKIEKNSRVQVLFGLVFAGALGNLIDRLVHGHVIDFINFSFWPTFNAADSAICIGGIGLALIYWKKNQ